MMVHKKAKSWVSEPQLQRQQFQPRGADVRTFARPPVPVQQGLAPLHPSRVHPELRAIPVLRSFATSVASQGTLLLSARTHASLSCILLHLVVHRAMRW